MTIYFFTSDTIGNNISTLRVGDICLLEYKDTTFVWVHNEASGLLFAKESKLNVQYSFYSAGIELPSNGPRIFSFDGTHKRTGNRRVITSLITSIEDFSIRSFFENVLSVLDYCEDRLNIVPVLDLLKRPIVAVKLDIKSRAPQDKILELQPKVENLPITEVGVYDKGEHYPKSNLQEHEGIVYMKQKTEVKLSYPPSSYYFFDYLPEKSQSFWNEKYSSGMDLRHIYHEIKACYKSQFKSAFKRFTADYPELNLYSRHEMLEEKASEESNRSSKRNFDFLYASLKKEGFIQISKDVWRDKDNMEYIIHVEPREG